MSSFKIQVRASDNYINGTELAQVLDVKVSNWRASLGFSSRLQKIQEKTGLDEINLYQARKKHSTYIHPLLAFDMIEYSKASNKSEVRTFVQLLTTTIESESDIDIMSEEKTTIVTKQEVFI